MLERFGQVVVGPPGSGKTTYCHAMKQYMAAINRPTVLINMDPSNDLKVHDTLTGENEKDLNIRDLFDVDIRDLISVEDAMEEFGLGPNGAILYCLEFALENLGYLRKAIDGACQGVLLQQGNKTTETSGSVYLIFDCPGQVEVSAVEEQGGLKRMLSEMVRGKRNESGLPIGTVYRLTAVHLLDATMMANAMTLISAFFLALNSQIMLELPCINLFTKADLLGTVKDSLQLSVREYMEVDMIRHLIDGPLKNQLKKEGVNGIKHHRFLDAVFEMVEDSQMMNFGLLDIHDAASMGSSLRLIDGANGFHYSEALVDVAKYRDSAVRGPNIPDLLKMSPGGLEDILERKGLVDSIVEKYTRASDDIDSENPK